MEHISRKKAKVLGLNRYFTGKPCKPHGHICERRVTGYDCVECRRAKERKKSKRKQRVRRQGDGTSYVYMVAASDEMHKVGITENLRRRLKMLQAGSPVRLNLVSSVTLHAPYEATVLEKRIHDKLETSRSHYEWFCVDRRTALDVFDQCVAEYLTPAIAEAA